MLLLTLYIIGITAEAMTGALSAGRKQMDTFGVIIIACVTALGGGSVRDMLLGSYPLTWIAHPEYMVITSVAAVITIAIAPIFRYLRKLFLMLDAIGLVTFAIIATQKTLDLGHGIIIASIMAVVTGVFGGVLRDILCNDVPLVFRKEIYGSIALMVALLYHSLTSLLHVPMDYAVIITLVAGVLVRIAAIGFKLDMPQFKYNSSEH